MLPWWKGLICSQCSRTALLWRIGKTWRSKGQVHCTALFLEIFKNKFGQSSYFPSFTGSRLCASFSQAAITGKEDSVRRACSGGPQAGTASLQKYPAIMELPTLLLLQEMSPCCGVGPPWAVGWRSAPLCSPWVDVLNVWKESSSCLGQGDEARSLVVSWWRFLVRNMDVMPQTARRGAGVLLQSMSPFWDFGWLAGQAQRWGRRVGWLHGGLVGYLCCTHFIYTQNNRALLPTGT